MAARAFAAPAGYVVRPARAGEVAALPAIEAAAATLHGGGEAFATTTPIDELEGARRRGHLLVAATAGDERPVGFAVLGERAGELLLEEIDVHPDHGRRGLGATLVRAVIELAAATGAARLVLSTMRDLPFNAPFYAAHGFVALADDALTPALHALRAAEAARGLPIARRVIMARPLGRSSRLC